VAEPESAKKPRSRLLDVAWFMALLWVSLTFFFALLKWKAVAPAEQSTQVILVAVTGAGIILGTMGVLWALMRKQ
jgi:hypothetical protein